MKKYLFFFFSFIAVQTVSAALPPLWQSVNEIKAILDDPELGVKLASGEMILKIKRSEEGWSIVTSRHYLAVRVIPQPQTMPGPAKFKLEFEEPSPHE